MYDLWALRWHCRRNLHAVVLNIATWAWEYCVKLLSLNTVCCCIKKCSTICYTRRNLYINYLIKSIHLYIKAVCSARCSSRCWPTTALPSSAPTTSSSSLMTQQWWVSSATTMKRTTERKWHSWLNGVALTICPSMWGRQRRLCWTSGGGTPLTTPHWPSTARLWRESAALNSWGCTSQRISPGPPTPCHSPRRHNSAYTFSAGWKEQASLHPSSPHSTGAPLRVCWPAASLSGTGTVVQQTTRPYSGQWTQLQRSCPSPIHPGHFLCTMLQQNQQHREGPHPPLPQSLPAPTIRKTVPEHQSPLRQTAQQPFPPGCESPELKSPRPPLKPHTNPYLLKHGPSISPHTPTPLQTPPNLTTPKKKLYETFLCNAKCATHRWVGLFKPPVVTHSPLCALDTFHTLLCTQSHKRLSNICMFTCSCTTNHLVLFPSQLLDSQYFSLHMYSIYVKHLYSLYSLYFLFLFFIFYL